MSAQQKTPLRPKPQGSFKNPGNTYFRVCCTIIGSESLTTVFGMGTGVAFRICSPGRTRRAVRLGEPVICCCVDGILRRCQRLADAASPSESWTRRAISCSLESVGSMWPSVCPLVPVSSMHYCNYTSGLLTWSSSRGLPRKSATKPDLGEGFTLRCFQRLSFPHLAIQPCH